MTTNVEITELPEKSRSGNTIVHVSVDGLLTRERYDFLEEGLMKLIEKHGVICIMLVFQKWDGMTSPAVREELQFETNHIAEIDRVAVIFAAPEDQSVLEPAVPFRDMNRRFFPMAEAEQAREWLQQA